ncbi:MAG: hypothetical protein CME61_01245 [Halobacteriovoraceae bacterium]|nr:hypothetical protein [Halobacteriovoraceae bacterium]
MLRFIVFCTLLLTFINVKTFSVEQISETKAHEMALLASQNPKKFHEGIKDITKIGPVGAMTLEMAKFYYAVAAVEFTHCIMSSDGTLCDAFVESLKDPISHIGFAIFMKSNHMTMEMVQIVTRGKINPGISGYLGLASGMMAQSIFHDLFYHPRVQELLRVNRIENKEERITERKKVLNNLWDDFINGSGSYLFNKIPNVLGLLGTAYLSHKTTQIAGKALSKSERLIRFTTNKKTSNTIINYGKNLKKKKDLTRAGIKFVWNGTKFVRIHPVVAVGTQFVETVVFLLYAPVVEGFVVKQWDLSHSLSSVKDSEKNLRASIQRNDHPEVVKKWSQSLVNSWESFREIILRESSNKKSVYAQKLQDIDIRFQKLFLYYEWLLNGMNYKSEIWKNNPFDFHKLNSADSINEATRYAEHFFCGKNPEDAVTRTTDYLGVPLIFKEEFTFHYDQNLTHFENMLKNYGKKMPLNIHFSPFQVHYIPGLCESDLKKSNWNKKIGPYDKILCPVDYRRSLNFINWEWNFTSGTVCRLDMAQSRKHILKTGVYKGKNIKEEIQESLDESFGSILKKVWSQRDLIIFRYEKSIREKLIEALIGRDVDIDKNDNITVSGDVESTAFFRKQMPLGIIPHYEYEINYWTNLLTRYPQYDEVFYELIQIAKRKMKASKDLLTYSKLPYRFRVRKNNFVKEVPKEEWKKIIQSLREFVIY